jgi:hypothetical protein
MSTDRDVTRTVRSWLNEDGHENADRVLDSVRDQLDTTPQRRAGWPARRFPLMNNALRIAVVAAAAVVVAFIGIRFLLPGDNLGGPGPSATPIPTATPEPSPTPDLTTYSIDIPELPGAKVTLTMPPGWAGAGWNVAKNDVFLGLWPVTNVYTDPCQWSGSLPDPPVGPTVEDLATALANQPTRNATETDVTLDGYSGKLVRMSVPADINFADCDNGQFGSWVEAGSDNPSRYAQGPGQLEDVYILDVGGVRVVIADNYFPTSAAADLADLQEILASLTIQP